MLQNEARDCFYAARLRERRARIAHVGEWRALIECMCEGLRKTGLVLVRFGFGSLLVRFGLAFN